ncbi:MAG: Nif11-like leader peptide family natural product precursor [Ectothiorhodospiraceae bacterium]|nr:Nif11-like leader peptide family natural product precursor [Ectothiorhodospiraceae bacterium]
MGIDEARKFLAALDGDEGLAVAADDAYVGALCRIAESAGFRFSEDDLRATLDGAGADLDDAELEHVVGGASQAITFWSGSAGALSRPGVTRFGSFSKVGFSR